MPRFEIQYAGGVKKEIQSTDLSTARDFFESIWTNCEGFEEGGSMPMKLIMIEMDGDEEVETVVVDLSTNNLHA